MNTSTRVAAAVTGSVAILAAVLVAAPSVAATDPGRVAQPGPRNVQNRQNGQQPGVCDGTAAHRGNGQAMNGQGAGRQGRGPGMGAGMGADLTNLASGTLVSAQKTSLAAMAEEEKLAHDLYVTLAARYGTTSFSRIGNAETRHLTEVRFVLTRYNITDPTAGKAVGAFATASTQQLYNKLVAQGTASLDGAYAAARTVETTDIADLNKAKSGVSAPDVLAVYAQLLAGSQRHLVAFGG